MAEVYIGLRVVKGLRTAHPPGHILLEAWGRRHKGKCETQKLCEAIFDIATKRHKIHKKIIYILEYQIVMGVKNINLDFLQDHQLLTQLSFNLSVVKKLILTKQAAYE